jgi:hypothetical protein
VIFYPIQQLPLRLTAIPLYSTNLKTYNEAPVTMTGRTWTYFSDDQHAASPNGVAKAYRNDPYKAPGRVIFYEDEPIHHREDDFDRSTPNPVIDEPPMGTRHTAALWGRVSFVPYPTEPFYATPAPEDDMVRVFIGQLPYFVTDMQLSWLCATFGGGHVVAYPERIMKRQPNGDRLPTGCIHAYASVYAVEAMATGMHKRMLVDDTGVWHAQTAAEFDVLSSYVASMKADKSLRVPNRPYDSVVVQLATSTYVPINPMPLTQFPNERPTVKGRQPRSKPTHAAPPAYYDSVAPPPPYSHADVMN